MGAGLKILVSAVPRLRRYEPRIRLSDLRDWVDADEPIPLSNSQLHVRDPLA
jgi:phage baseplate assembly protein W